MLAVIGGGGFVGTNILEGFPGFVRSIEQGDPFDFEGCDTIIHLAANADVRDGWSAPYRDLEYGPVLTQHVLEAMRAQKVRRLIFASSCIVYPPSRSPHHEDEMVQATSLYAASKIAGEQLIAAYSAAGHIDAAVLRFVSVLGPHYSHGLLVDFVNKLADDPSRLPVLAPGTSEKSYVHVGDVVRAVDSVLDREAVGTFNVATNETANPLNIARWTMQDLDLEPNVVLEGETWVGDNPVIRADTTRLRRLGWEPQHTIRGAVKDTVRWLQGAHDGRDQRVPQGT